MGIVLVLALSASMFVAMKGSRVLLTLYAVELGAGPFATGMLFALYGLPPFLFAVRFGRVADALGNRGLMYAGLASYAVSLSIPFFFPFLPVLFVVAALYGFTTMLFVVATQNLVGLFATPENRTRNFSYYSLADSGGAVAGPILVGVAIDQVGHAPTFALAALIPLACMAVLHLRRRDIPDSARGPRAGPATGSIDLLRLPALRSALVTNAVVMTGLDLYNVYFPVYAKGAGHSATTIGLMMGAFGAAAFAIRLFIPVTTRRWGEHRVIAWALVLGALAFAAIPLMHSPWLLGLVSFAVGLGIGCGQPLSMSLAFSAAPPGRSAEAIGWRLATSYGSHVLIPPVFGAFGSVIGLGPVFWTCGLLLTGGSYLNRRAAR